MQSPCLDSGDEASLRIDRSTYQHMFQDIVSLKTMLLKLKRVLQEVRDAAAVQNTFSRDLCTSLSCPVNVLRTSVLFFFLYTGRSVRPVWYILLSLLLSDREEEIFVILYASHFCRLLINTTFFTFHFVVVLPDFASQVRRERFDEGTLNWFFLFYTIIFCATNVASPHSHACVCVSANIMDTYNYGIE